MKKSNKQKIHKLAYVSMSISGSLTKDSNYYANYNWQSSGSRHPLSASNLFVLPLFLVIVYLGLYFVSITSEK